MTKHLPILIIPVLLFSCKKDNPTSATNVSAGTTNSYSHYSPANHYFEKDTLIYDMNQDLVKISHYDYDSSAGPTLVYVDSGSYSFTVNPSTGYPSSYTILWYNSALAVSQDEIHNLFYDNQDRLIKDSLSQNLVSSNDAHLSVYYTYSGNDIFCNAYSQSSPDSVSYTDTITLNNGNVVRQSAYTGDLSSNFQVVFDTVNNYSNYANPLYSSSMALNIGVLLFNDNLFDALSRQLPADGIVTWTTDTKQRVVTAIANDGSIYHYTYK